MTHREHTPKHTDRSILDDQLDAALAQYSAVEPRAGHEERILASMRAEQDRPTSLAWWRWAAVSALILAVSLFLWRMESTRHTRVVRNTPTQKPQSQQPAPAIPPTRQEPARHAARREPRHAPSIAVSIAPPKLDTFPSPLPLTAEERRLALYVSHFRRQAALLARIRTEELQQDLARRAKELDRATGTNSTEEDAPNVNR